jgi:hypothetical protein
MPGKIPQPTLIYRLIHIDNLRIYLVRRGIYAPSHTPGDGLDYRPIHYVDIQNERQIKSLHCGPGGVIHDYVPFYFGTLSPMLLCLKSGRVEGYNEGQEPLIYLVSSAQRVAESGAKFIFSDGHGIASYTAWFCDLADLERVDWDTVRLKYWGATRDDMDRQRRKQAEFLVHEFCDWSLILGIGVINDKIKRKVEEIQSPFPAELRKEVVVKPAWYY